MKDAISYAEDGGVMAKVLINKEEPMIWKFSRVNVSVSFALEYRSHLNADIVQFKDTPQLAILLQKVN